MTDQVPDVTETVEGFDSAIEEAIFGDSQSDEPLPVRILTEYKRKYPGAEKEAAWIHERKGEKGKPDWPGWCYLPEAGTWAVVEIVCAKLLAAGRGNQIPPEKDFPKDVNHLSSLLAWRMGKGIYRFDETIFYELCRTPHTGELPTDILMRLPSWGVYVETPTETILKASTPDPSQDTDVFDMVVDGFFAHVDFYVPDKSPVLCLLLVLRDGFFPVRIDLSCETIEEGVKKTLVGDKPEESWTGPLPLELSRNWLSQTARAILPMLLYIASANAEISPIVNGEVDGEGDEMPSNPKPKKTRKGMKTFAEDNPKEWAVGWRLGEALRKNQELSERRERDGWRPPSGTKRGHVRRAHWHTYWIGPRPKEGQEPSPKRKRILKWLPPVPVNVTEDELPAVFHEVA